MIYVIAHRPFEDDFLDRAHYRVLRVGGCSTAAGELSDETGDSIAEKNPHYSELTGLYWIWKNGPEAGEDITGLVHYRRFFTTASQDLAYRYRHRKPSVLAWDVIEEKCTDRGVILPTQTHTLDTVYRTYGRMHYAEDLDLCREVIGEICPSYLPSFDKVMSSHRASYGNLLICRKKLLDAYCPWLFPILFRVDERIDYSRYQNDYQRRVIGFLSERLLDVWFDAGHFEVSRYPVYNTEKPGMNIFSLTAFRAQSLYRLLRGRSLRP